MADDRRRRQPLPPLPPLAQYPVNPPFNPAANQEPLPALPLPVASSSFRTRVPQPSTPKRERIAPRQPQPRPASEESPEREQPNRLYRLGLAHAGVTVVLVGWSIYCVVRYSLAIRVNLSRALRLPPRLHLVQQGVLFLGSVSLLIPTLFHLAFVSLWRHRSPAGSTMSLVGQCRWDIDVVWGGRSGQCPDGPAKWGGWLAGAIVRFIVTLLFSIACHWLTWLIDSDRRAHSAGSRQRSTSSASLMHSDKTRGRHPSKPAPPTSSSASSSHGHRRTFSSSNTAHASSPSSLTYIPHHLTRPAKSPSSTSKSPPKGYEATPRPSGSSGSHDPPVGRLSPTSDISDYYSDVDDGGDLNRFAANFRTLVERVSRETEDGARLPSPSPIYNLTRPAMSRTNSAPPPTAYAPPSAHPPRRSPSPRNSSSRRSSLQENNGAGPSSPTTATTASRSNELDAHAQMQHDLLQAHRLMLLEQAMRAESYEHIVVLGGAVRRMSTIASVADGSERSYREPPWTPTSGTSSYMTPMELTRSPSSSTARSGRRNPMSRHAITPPPGSVGLLTDSFQSERGHYTD
ncbi:hypothetical protein FS837_005098 [Tulasnella sp. UAMH 9824]|nr:hypothetical protein FS837_005098 [Tulasnella sp. UAMH 9824]